MDPTAGGVGSSGEAAPLTVVVVELGRLLERRMHYAVRDHGVSVSQLMALLRIVDRPGISRADLARGLQVSPQAVGGLTTQLIDKGLITRAVADPGRPSAFTATEEGRRVLVQAGAVVEDLSQDMLRFFRPNLAAGMDGALRHLLKRLS